MTVTTIAAGSKPDAVAALRATWRQSAEHKTAQIKRFLSALGAILTLQIVGDITAQKNPLEHFTDARTAWFYLVPLVYVAWRQIHPAMTASQVDEAPGATIVPEQVGLLAAAALPLPVQTDNTEKPGDPPQDVSQDPSVDLSVDSVDIAEPGQ